MAKEAGLSTKHSSILSRKIKEIELSNYGKLISLTPSDETNLLAIEYSQIINFGNY